MSSVWFVLLISTLLVYRTQNVVWCLVKSNISDYNDGLYIFTLGGRTSRNNLTFGNITPYGDGPESSHASYQYTYIPLDAAYGKNDLGHLFIATGLLSTGTRVYPSNTGYQFTFNDFYGESHVSTNGLWSFPAMRTEAAGSSSFNGNNFIAVGGYDERWRATDTVFVYHTYFYNSDYD